MNMPLSESELTSIITDYNGCTRITFALPLSEILGFGRFRNDRKEQNCRSRRNRRIGSPFRRVRELQITFFLFFA